MKKAPFVLTENTKASTTEAFGKTLSALGAENPNIVALTADLKGSVKMNDFGSKFPERMYDVGIAEQNMFGIAAGMAKCGFTPFAATFSVFASLRALDQIHTDICYQNLNVKIVGTHGGTSFAAGGSTHHAIEDFAVIRGLVNMTLVCPADSVETALAVREAANNFGPYYIRLNRGTDPIIYDTDDYGFKIGKAVKVCDGNDLTIIACGSCVSEAIKAAEILAEKHKISARVLNMHTLKPIDADAIISAAKETGTIITAEDHTIIGGLGSAVCEVVAESGINCKVKRLGLNDCFSAIGGSHDDLLEMYDISAKRISEVAVNLLK